MRLLSLIAALVLLLAATACNGDSDSNGGPTNTSGAPEDTPTATPADHAFFGSVVQYDNEAMGPITAELLAPEGATGTPGILLLHELGGSRQQWAEFAPMLAGEGYTVLVPDLAYEDHEPAELMTAVRGGIDYLRAQPGVDPARVVVFGSSYGANLAYVASGIYPDLTASVAMSPNSRPDNDALIGNGFPNFAPRSVLLLSDEVESGDTTSLANDVEDPVAVKIYTAQAAHGGRPRHGVELLKEEQVVTDLLGWFQETFAPVH
jgi:dienelactone hydrolase